MKSTVRLIAKNLFQTKYLPCLIKFIIQKYSCVVICDPTLKYGYHIYS